MANQAHRDGGAVRSPTVPYHQRLGASLVLLPPEGIGHPLRWAKRPANITSERYSRRARVAPEPAELTTCPPSR